MQWRWSHGGSFRRQGRVLSFCFSVGWKPQGELRQPRARNLLCITLTCPYRRLCPCLNPIHEILFRIRAWNFCSRWTDALRAVGRVTTSFIYLSGAARASLLRFGAMQKKQRALLSTGMRRPAAAQPFCRLAGQSWIPRPICSQRPRSHISHSVARLHRNSVVEKERKQHRIARDNWIQIDCA